MDLAADALSVRDTYALMTSLVVPRAIGWVSTQTAPTADGAGRTNLAPFSYFTALGSDPPMLTLGIADKKGAAKDTLRNLRDTGVFCVNLVEEPLLQQMNTTSGDHPPEVDELALVGLTPVPCVSIAGVRVGESRAAMECRLVDVHTYGRKTRVSLVVGEVLRFHVDDAIMVPGRTAIDPRAIRPVARMGGPTYALLGAIIELERPVLVPTTTT